MNTGDFTNFLASLGAFESEINTKNTDSQSNWFSQLGVFDSAPGGIDQHSVDTNSYVFAWDWGSHPVIVDFDVSCNTIDLSRFLSHYSELSLSTNENGDAVIDLSNLSNQTITLENVAVDELSAANFVGVEGDFADALQDNAIDLMARA